MNEVKKYRNHKWFFNPHVWIEVAKGEISRFRGAFKQECVVGYFVIMQCEVCGKLKKEKEYFA